MTKNWDEVWHHIKDLYITQKKPLNEVRRIMSEEHGFTASTRAYRQKLQRFDTKRSSSTKGRDDKIAEVANDGRETSSKNKISFDLANAIIADDYETVISLLRYAKSNGWDPITRWLQLHEAAHHGSSTAIFRALLDYGADVNSRTADGSSVLFMVLKQRLDGKISRQHSLKIINLLLSRGAEVAPSDDVLGEKTDPTPLLDMFIRVWTGKPLWYRNMCDAERETLIKLIGAGAPTDCPFDSKHCGTFSEVSFQHEVLFHTPGSGLAKAMVDAVPVLADGNGDLLLHALMRPCPSRQCEPSDPSLPHLIERLLSRGAMANDIFEDGSTLLTTAINYVPDEQILDVMKTLVTQADPLKKDDRGCSPLEQVARKFENPLRHRLLKVMLQAVTELKIDTTGILQVLTDTSLTAAVWPMNKLFPITDKFQYYADDPEVESCLSQAFRDSWKPIQRAIIDVSTSLYMTRIAGWNASAAAGCREILSCVLQLFHVRRKFEIHSLEGAGEGLTGDLFSILYWPVGGPGIEKERL